MLEKIKTLITEYAQIYAKAWETLSFKHPIAATVRNDIAQEFRNLSFLDSDIYSVKASCGTGRFTAVPWIAIFDRRITDTAQKGVYVVYLLNKDTQELFLTLNQAATGTTVSELRDNAKKIRMMLRVDDDEAIATGSDAYDAGCIISKKYCVEDLNSEESFLNDLKVFLAKYQQYQDVIAFSGWWPSQEEYPLNLTKEDWKQYILEVEMPNHPSPMKMLKGMMELGGEASCKLLSDTYGKHPSVYAGCAMNLGRRVKKYFDLPACMDGDQERYFPFPFVGKYQGSSQDNYLYKIRPELFDALNEIDLSSINPNYEEDHKLGVFDSWEIIDENTAIKHCDKFFFDYRGSGVPKGICWFFGAEDMNLGETKIVKLIYNGKQYLGSVKNESSDRRRVRIFWSTELGSLFDAFNVPEATATFKKIADDTYEVSIKGGEKEMTIKEKIAAIKAYIAARGFNYEGDLIENFYLSLKSKPFVILAGTSGTGKTKLVEYFAEAIGAKMQLVPVRPDWSDSSDLFGHKDLSGNFHPGAIIDFIKSATDSPSVPHFLCLDEMNLARVEYYMSDMLSIIETRRFNDQHKVVTKPLIAKDYCICANGRNDYGELGIPDNLYIIGTVNMDETTFPFSKKVLDRANTIEFSFVDLTRKALHIVQYEAQELDNSFLKAEYLHLIDCGDDQLIDDICFDLNVWNQILVKANLHVGYRVRDEICFYMMNNKKSELLDFETAFDHEIMQKILPRVQGSSSAIKDVLSELFVKCAGDYAGFDGTAAYEKMQSYLDTKPCKYPNSAKKIAFMMRRYEEDGFTSYWI